MLCLALAAEASMSANALELIRDWISAEGWLVEEEGAGYEEGTGVGTGLGSGTGAGGSE